VIAPLERVRGIARVPVQVAEDADGVVARVVGDDLELLRGRAEGEARGARGLRRDARRGCARRRERRREGERDGRTRVEWGRERRVRRGDRGAGGGARIGSVRSIERAIPSSEERYPATRDARGAENIARRRGGIEDAPRAPSGLARPMEYLLLIVFAGAAAAMVKEAIVNDGGRGSLSARRKNDERASDGSL